MSRHLFVPGHYDRHIGTGRSEGLAALATIADGPAIKRLLDPGVSHPAALSDGGGEGGMAAAPVLQGCDVDLEEIGDVGWLSTETAELAGLSGERGVIGWRGWRTGA